MTFTIFQKRLAVLVTILASFSAIGASISGAYNWIDSTVVTKSFLTEKLEQYKKSSDIETNDLRLLIIEQGLSSYYSKGLDNLSDKETHHYNKLVLAEATNETRRNELLGL